MKRFSLLCVLAILCSLPAYSQFWISFGWNEPHCQNCLWMEQAMHLPARQAAEYHKIIHKYGQKIEKEARRELSVLGPGSSSYLRFAHGKGS